MASRFILEAPYPALASTILMPNPRMGNNLGLKASVSIVRMYNGDTRTYVKSAGRKKLHRWSFVISHDKMLELTDFVLRYPGAEYRATWRDRVVVGKLTLNPVEPIGAGRAGGWPGDESYEVTLELREV